MKTAVYEFLVGQVGATNVFVQEKMAKHTSFRVGGEADYFVEIPSIQTLQAIIKYLQNTDHDYYIVGNGSNLLVGDKGFEGVILHLGNQFATVEVMDTSIRAQAGAMLGAVAKVALQTELTGFEFAAGIPGTVGGAMVMNAGAYDGEMRQIVKQVNVLNQDGDILELDNDTMEFGYRTSILKSRPLIVLETVFSLQKGKQEIIQEKMDIFAQKRRDKQPLEFPSAGSTFKRPEGNFAGKLIMDAGLRGYRIGGAQVSEKHCGFVINVGNATAADVSELMEDVVEKVKDQFQVELEPEIIRIGSF